MIDPNNPFCDEPHEIAPWADQYGGPYSYNQLIIQPAVYQKRTNPAAMIQLSYPTCEFNFDGSPNPNFNPQNPRSWNHFLKSKLETEGFRPALDYLMEQLHSLGFREVWFWGFAGHQRCDHTNADFYSAMPWLTLDAWTPAMLNSWQDFVVYWNSRGVSFGIYLGSIHTPNHGTTLNPDFRWLTRADYAFVGNTLLQARNMGFKMVGLDAYTLGQSTLDVAPFGNPLYWPPNPDDHPLAGQPRDKGLMVDLLAYLRGRADLQNLHLEIESWVPHSKAQSLAADLTVIRPTANPSSWPTIYEFMSNAKYAPYYKELLNPGFQVTALVMFTGWTVQEFGHAILGLRAYGYRPMFSVYTTLGPLGCLRINPDLPNEPLSIECIDKLLGAF